MKLRIISHITHEKNIEGIYRAGDQTTALEMNSKEPRQRNWKPKFKIGVRRRKFLRDSATLVNSMIAE